MSTYSKDTSPDVLGALEDVIAPEAARVRDERDRSV
jgi:hypothetical protein